MFHSCEAPEEPHPWRRRVGDGRQGLGTEDEGLVFGECRSQFGKLRTLWRWMVSPLYDSMNLLSAPNMHSKRVRTAHFM